VLDPDAVRLAKELDGLPLALATAGAYLDQVTINLSDYLRLYKVMGETTEDESGADLVRRPNLILYMAAFI
jgi:hypothetical protein